MDFEPEIGSIIEFDDGDQYRIAIVTDTIGKKKLAILAADGAEMRTERDDISFELGSGSVGNPERASKNLQELESTIGQRRADVDLEMLWEFVREDGDVLEAGELAEVMFADDSAESVLAVIRALRDNPVYFKNKRGYTYEPRPDGKVANLREQREAELAKQRERNRVLESIGEMLELPKGERKPRADELINSDDALRNALYLLQDYAAEGDDFFRSGEAKDWLDDLNDHIDVSLPGSGELKAFHLMVELGIWDEHYNLAMHRYNIDPEMPDDIVERAREVVEEPWEPEPYRRDMTDWTTVTIDAPHSRDLDDALSCRPTIDGGFELAIHITDPSAMIERDGPLDREAEKRGTSVYLPTGSVPMFPRQLSEEKMSLLPGKTRPALTALVTFDASLEVVDSEILLTTIEVDRRLSYDEVDAMLDGEESGRFPDLVARLEHVADECHNRRTEDGGAYFDLPDMEMEVDADSDPPEVEVESVETETRSRALVSELMVLNNEMVGKFCARREIPAIFRTQPPPEQPLVDDEIEAIPEGVARTFAQIYRMNRGETTSQPGRHFGLGLNTYAQASSPIRRYIDLVCQRQVKAAILDEPLPYDQDGILEVLGSVERAMSSASSATRASERYWLLYYLDQHDEPLDGIVIDHYDDQGSRVSVFLTDCAYKSKCTLRNKVPVGHEVRVEVERADPRRDILSLRQARDD